jgi:hypothetical protein
MYSATVGIRPSARRPRPVRPSRDRRGCRCRAGWGSCASRSTSPCCPCGSVPGCPCTGAAGHFHARAGLAEDRVVAFLVEDHRVHLGRRGDPQAGRDVGLAFEDLAGGAEVADVGHARADEDLVDLGRRHCGEQLDVVRIVRAGDQRLQTSARSISITAAYCASASA